MPGAHAKLSPSAASRWIQCPASVSMAEKHKAEEKESAYAREGTIAHTLAEVELSHALGLTSAEEYRDGLAAWKDEAFDAGLTSESLDEMDRHVQSYVEIVLDRAQIRPHSMVFVEQKVDTGVPHSWGTGDTIIVSPTHVEIIDLKYGQGVFVSARRNAQLRLYGAGALDAYGDLLGEPDAVMMTVVQPRLDHVDTEELTPRELRFWREETAIPAAWEALDAAPRFGPSESACRFCPAAAVCRPRAEYLARQDFDERPEELSVAELAEKLAMLGQVKDWAAAVERHALSLAHEHGERIPGFKVVRSGGRRVVQDPAAAIQILIDQGFAAEEVAEFKVKPLGTLEKIVGKTDLPKVLGDLLQKTEGRPSLVPASDKRPEIEPAATAAEDFSAAD